LRRKLVRRDQRGEDQLHLRQQRLCHRQSELLHPDEIRNLLVFLAAGRIGSRIDKSLLQRVGYHSLPLDRQMAVI